MTSGWALVVIVCLAGAAPVLADQAPERATGDAASARRGQILFISQCRACHSIESGSEPQKIGPGLGKLLDRQAGSVPGYGYSDGMKKSGVRWTAENLDVWLQKPSAMVPGTTMTFAGLSSQSDRSALVAYLVQATSTH